MTVTKKPNKPWKDRKKSQFLKGKVIKIDLVPILKQEIARWNNKRSG